MNNSTTRHYYVFRGAYIQKIEEVITAVLPNQNFEIWKPRNNDEELYLLVINNPLPGLYSLGKNIWETSEKIAERLFINNRVKYTIYIHEQSTLADSKVFRFSKLKNLFHQPLSLFGNNISY
jgi:hypothetical protein